jgi:TnpA family transposase
VLAKSQIKLFLIPPEWDDILRLLASLKLGRVPAEGIMRTLQVADKPTSLAKAIAEIGRIDKTIHMLNYLHDKSFRRQTLVQLNLGEGRHSLGRAVFHGKRGELHQRYRAGQEDQLGALGLVLNIITLWNTIYMDAAINQLRQEGFPVYDEDVARLSAYGYGQAIKNNKKSLSRLAVPLLPKADNIPSYINLDYASYCRFKYKYLIILRDAYKGRSY